MPWLAIKLLGLLSPIRAAFQWALRNPLIALCLILAAVAGVQSVRAHKWHKATLVAKDALRSQQAAILAGQKAAEAMDKARNVRVAAEQQRISDDVTTDYRARLADLRARYDRLRAEGAGSAPGGEQVPVLPASAPGTDPAPGDELAWRLLAAQQAEQLDALISWTVAQAAVPVN